MLTNTPMSRNTKLILLVGGLVVALFFFNAIKPSGKSNINVNHTEKESAWAPPPRSHSYPTKARFQNEYDLLPSGSPTIEAFQKMKANPIFTQWVEPFSDKFLADNKEQLEGYRQQWVLDPLHSWSRRWEYVFIAAAIRKYIQYEKDLFILDIGSGVTFIDYMVAYDILADNPRARVMALDSNPTYQNYFDAINKNYAGMARRKELDQKYAIPKVQLVEHDTQRGIPVPDNSIDLAFCVSVLEHVPDTISAVRNIYQTIKPGGFFVVTYDIDVTGQIVGHTPAKADLMLKELRTLFKEVESPDAAPIKTYNTGPFTSGIVAKSDLFNALYGRNDNLDVNPWIKNHGDQALQGLSISCHVFQKIK